MRLQGKISEWNDARGFGFVQPNGGGERCFVHIRSFSARDRRPVLGDVITYDVQNDAQGRRNAVAVRFALGRDGGRNTLTSITATTGGKDRLPRKFVGVVFLISLAAAAAWRQWPLWVPILYVAMSGLTYLWYWHDKSAAQYKRGRTPEKHLHMLALLCGWPGALLAQSILRHKNRKAPFQRVFWLTVVINVTVLAWLLHEGLLPG
jgi:uncharacterized membrane protein YsdA (DUF1294 family)/cold shock CspA family protein